jgi:hypothetical protein
VAGAGIGSAAARVAPNRRAAAENMRELIDFMLKALMAEASGLMEGSVFDGFDSGRIAGGSS